jgi:PAS domain S-box-containing protein
MPWETGRVQDDRLQGGARDGVSREDSRPAEGVRADEVRADSVQPDVVSPLPPDLGPCKLLAEQIRDILLIVSPHDGRILEINPAAMTAYGHSRDALRRMTLADLRPPDEVDSILAQLGAAEREGILFETTHVRKDGTTFPVEVSARGADIAGQRVIISLVRDVSHRKSAEVQLRRSHDTFYNLIQNAPFGVYLIDSRFRLAQVSAGSQRVFEGVRPLIGRDFAEVLRTIWPEPFASDAIARFRHTLETGERFHSSATVERRADVNEVEAYDWRLERIALPDGEFGVVCYFYDLSERRRHETALKESQERQRIAVDSARLGVFEWHIPNDVAVWENDRPYEIFGRPRHLGPIGREEFLRDFLHPEDRAKFAAPNQSDLGANGRVSWTVRIRRPDGEIRWIEITGNVTVADDGSPLRMLGVIGDVTARKSAELALRQSEECFRNLANAMPQLVWTANNNGVVTYYNSQAAKYSGLEQTETGEWQWEPLVHADDIAVTSRLWNAAVASGATYECEHRIKMADGSYRWHLSRAFRPSADSQWFGTATDVHELKLTEDALRASQQELARHKDELERRVHERTEELSATHARLRLSERFAMMGTLAAGLGHDLGNLLVPVRVRLESLSHASLDPQAQEDVAAIRTSAEYLRRLAQGLRLLSLDPERASRNDSTDIAAWWNDVHGVLRSALPRHVELASDVGPDAGIARISKPALTQVIFNIFQNAGDAMRELDKGMVQIRAHRVDGWVHISIEDNGPGMPDDVKARCMEPFFTTKSRGISTGLGLVLVYGLVRDAGGRVKLESHMGKGTRFTLVLPMSQADSPNPIARCTCLIDIKDARIRSIVSGELGALNVEHHTWDSRDGHEHIAILDDAMRIRDLPVGTATVLLATSVQPHRNVRALGDRPSIGEIRQAIRAAVTGAPQSKPEL